MKLYTTIIISFFTLTSCSELIDIDAPKHQLSPEQVYGDSTTVSSLLANTYALVERTVEVNISGNMGLYTDDFSYTGLTTLQIEFWNSRLSLDNIGVLNVWKNLYAIIYQCNDLLKHIEDVPISDQQKTSVKGQCLFLRAFSYYFLVNLFERVPLVLDTEVNENRLIAQSDPEEIYAIIIKDLLKAKAMLLPEDQNIYANSEACSALLAKLALQVNDWESALEESSFVINSGKYILEEVDKVFYYDSKETILQFWTKEGYVSSAIFYIPDSESEISSTVLTDNLYDSFDKGDLRKLHWIGTNEVTTSGEVNRYHFPYKYKNRSLTEVNQEYLIAVRLGELYLLRAEALFHLGRVDEAMADVNTIRTRAGLAAVSASDTETGLTILEEEWRKELFGEWGMRFINLKRQGKLNQIIGNLKPTWTSSAKNLPIPQNELMYNPNLKQNPGYN